MEGVSVEGLGAEVQIRSNQLFGLAQEKVSSWLQVEVQALDQRDALGTGQVGQHIHTENAVEASDIAGACQVHAIESHQAAQARLYEQVRRICRSSLGCREKTIL